jgi:hypothetical protein
MNKLMIALASVVMATAPAAAQTQGQTHASHGPAKPAEKVGCKTMAKKMGMGQQHSHAEEKGTVAHSAMNHEHMRCKAAQDEKKDK